METNKIIINESDNSKKSKIKKLLYNIFVKNLAYKSIAFGTAIVMWILVVGLGFEF